MTTELIPTPIESIKYKFELIKALEEDNLKFKEAIQDVLSVLDGNGVPNTEWIKNRLLETIK